MLRPLFLNEGTLGIGPIGHVRVEEAVRAGLTGRDDVEARFASVPPMGWTTRALTRGIPGLRRPDLDLQVLRWHAIQALRARAVLRRELRAGPVDAIHVVSHSVAMAIRPEMRAVPTFLSVDVPVWEFRELAVWRELGRFSRGQVRPSLALERRSLAAAEAVLPWSGWARRGIERACPGATIVEHHPGLDLDRFRPTERRARPRPRVLFVAGRFEEKGGSDLLAALHRLPEGTVELDVVTKAEIPERPGIRVHRLDAGDPQLVELYQQADLFCLPTLGDASPWVVVEAMACGTPVVASHVGGIPELLDDGRAGVLVPPRDPETLAAALDDLLGDDAKRRALATAARRRCEERYDARRQTAQLLELMRSATERAQSGLESPANSCDSAGGRREW